MQNKLTLAHENDESKSESSSTAQLFLQLGSAKSEVVQLPEIDQLPKTVTLSSQKKQSVTQIEDLGLTLKLKN